MTIARSSIMFLAAWMFLTITWCSYAHAAPAPPLAAALSQPSQVFAPSDTQDDSIHLPEKELRRFFFPESQAVMDSIDDLYHISEPYSKKGYSGRNYLRFGRSIDRQVKSIPSQPTTRAERDVSAVHRNKFTESGKITSQRTKRGAPSMYMSLPSHSPSAWARDIRPEDEIISIASYEDSQDENKHGYNKGFLHLGSDNNFLRFGKRDKSSEYPSSSSSEYNESILMLRPVRLPQRNFIRFG